MMTCGAPAQHTRPPSQQTQQQLQQQQKQVQLAQQLGLCLGWSSSSRQQQAAAKAACRLVRAGRDESGQLQSLQQRQAAHKGLCYSVDW
jgi:hypothetical protein